MHRDRGYHKSSDSSQARCLGAAGSDMSTEKAVQAKCKRLVWAPCDAETRSRGMTRFTDWAMFVNSRSSLDHHGITHN
jgi:hypothetical protein